MEKSTLDIWAIVELMGHAKIAGRCTEENIAGAIMLRVDVPETSQIAAFTRYLGTAAIYAINPVSEAIARAVAESLLQMPPIPYGIRLKVIKDESERRKLPAPNEMNPGWEEEDLGHDGN